MILGVCGIIGAGKSEVCNVLEKKYGFSRIDLDDISKIVMNNNESITLIRNYIPEVIDREGEIDRSKLREILFTDWNKNKLIAKHIWPKVNELTFELLNILDDSSDINIVIESTFLPIMNLPIDKMLCVMSLKTKNNIKRIAKRDNRSSKETRSVIKFQRRWYKNKNFDFDMILLNNKQSKKKKSINTIEIKIDKLINNLKKEGWTFNC